LIAKFSRAKILYAEGCFSVSSGFHWFIFSNKFCSKKLLDLQFSRHAWHAPQKISFDLRSPEIFEALENLYPMFLHSFCIPASTFEIGNFDIPIFYENCSLFYLIKSILRS
jgi:hypothetical protein